MAGKSGGVHRGSDAERRALLNALVELTIEAMNDDAIRLSVVAVAERAGVARSALTHRNADIRLACKRVQEATLFDAVKKLRAERDDRETKLREANGLMRQLREEADLSARVIRALELQLDSVSQDGVIEIGAFRASKRRDASGRRTPD